MASISTDIRATSTTINDTQAISVDEVGNHSTLKRNVNKRKSTPQKKSVRKKPHTMPANVECDELDVSGENNISKKLTGYLSLQMFVQIYVSILKSTKYQLQPEVAVVCAKILDFRSFLSPDESCANLVCTEEWKTLVEQEILEYHTTRSVNTGNWYTWNRNNEDFQVNAAIAMQVFRSLIFSIQEYNANLDKSSKVELLFPLEALKFFLSNHTLLIDSTDFSVSMLATANNENNVPSLAGKNNEKRNAKLTLISHGQILLKYNQSPVKFSSLLAKSTQGDIEAVKLLVENKITFNNSLPTETSEKISLHIPAYVHFTTPEFEVEKHILIKASSHLQRVWVVMTNNHVVIYDAETKYCSIPSGNIQTNIVDKLTLLLSAENHEYLFKKYAFVVFDMFLIPSDKSKLAIFDFYTCSLKNVVSDGDSVDLESKERSYREKLNLLKKCFPENSIYFNDEMIFINGLENELYAEHTVQIIYKEIHYICHRSYVYEHTPLVGAVVGISNLSLLIAFRNNPMESATAKRDVEYLSINAKVNISSPEIFYQLTACYTKDPMYGNSSTSMQTFAENEEEEETFKLITINDKVYKIFNKSQTTTGKFLRNVIFKVGFLVELTTNDNHFQIKSLYGSLDQPHISNINDERLKKITKIDEQSGKQTTKNKDKTKVFEAIASVFSESDPKQFRSRSIQFFEILRRNPAFVLCKTELIEKMNETFLM